MAIDTVLPTSPAGVVAEARTLVGSLSETLWAAKTPAELVDTVQALVELTAVLAGVEVRALAEIHARGIATEQGWGSTGDWYTHTAGLRRGHGKRVVDRAVALTGDRGETLTALEEGRVSPDQAGVIVDAVDALPSNPVTRTRGVLLLLAEAARLDASDLARTGRHLVEVVDPDGQDRRQEAALDRLERAAHAGRRFTIADDGAGGVRVTGRGSAEDAALLRAALLPLTKPAPSPDGDRVDPHALDADPRDHGARMWDALIGIARHGLDHEVVPDSHGVQPRVGITVDYDTLHTGTGTGTWAGADCVTDDGITVSADVVRRWACDADLIPTVLGSAGEVLDVGRRHRLVTPGIWQALVVRDRHCAFPACTRPPVMCQGHHIRHWTDGGPTSLENLVMLCGHHHRTIHNTPWEVRLNPTDQKPEFTPPPRYPGDIPTPIRHRPRRD